MKTYIRNLGLVAITVALLGVLPAVQAQTVPVCAQDLATSQITLKDKVVTNPGGTENVIKPITGTAQVKFTFVYTADQQARSISPVPVAITHKASVPWLTTSVGQQNAFITINSESQEGTKEEFIVLVDVTASDQAPAFGKGDVTVTATGGTGTCVMASETSTASQQMIAGFYENYQARFQTAIWKTGQNERIQIPLIVNNYGNGHIKVQMAPSEGTGKRLNFALPGVQTVESQIAGGSATEVTIPIDIQTPFKNGYENRRDQFNLQVTGYYFADPLQKITPVDLQAVIQTQGVYVPGFDAVAMLGAVLGIALLARRRL